MSNFQGNGKSIGCYRPPALSATDRYSGLSPDAVVCGDSDSGAVGRHFRGVHELLDWVFYQRPGAGGDFGEHGDAAIRAGGETWSQLHADDGSVGGGPLWNGSAGAGHGLAGVA